MPIRTSALVPYASAVLKLLQDVVTHDDRPTWSLILRHQVALRAYLEQIGLELHLDEGDGYAFLRQPDLEDEQGQPISLPRLTRRMRLSYGVTLLCVILREQLDLFEASTPEADALIVSREQLHEWQRPFYREQSDERSLVTKLDTTINKVVELGYLMRRDKHNQRFEVRRVIRARIDADALAEIKARLEAHHADDV